MRSHFLVISLLVVALTFSGCSGVSSKMQSSNGGGSSAPQTVSFTPCVPGGTGIPCSFWGLQVNQLASYPVQIPYGQFRSWDSARANWPIIEWCQAASGSPSDPCFNQNGSNQGWTNLDAELADLKQQGRTDVFYTLSRTPAWASQNPNDTNCNYYRAGLLGECWPPTDLNQDGTGTNQIWRNWVAAIATRVNDATYLQTHAHIKYWETWNEFTRTTSWQGSNNQMVRLVEDANCIITGRVTAIIANGGEPCQHVLNSVGLTKSVDPQAVMVAPSPAGIDPVHLQAFLYCTNDPACTVGKAGANAVDVINVHLYVTMQTPENVIEKGLPGLYARLQPAELQKPLWNGEGSWGDTSVPGNIWVDDYAKAGFIPRYFALFWSTGITENFWYGYDFGQLGQLYDPTTGKLKQPQANAWILTYNWLSHAVPAQSPFCQNSGTVYHCDFTEGNGHKASLVWDTQYGQHCSNMSVPIVCGATNYNVPAQFNQDWIDLSGASHSAVSTVMIGANPILLEGQ